MIEELRDLRIEEFLSVHTNPAGIADGYVND